ncbi:hypothetical protein KX519_01960 [Escherichia coli]|nr:hypothetical protein [Escherichia coli]
MMGRDMQQFSDKKAQQLLVFVSNVEQAAKRGLEVNRELEFIPAEKKISTKQCEWILKDCKLFRSAIYRIFGLQQ